MFVTVQDFSSPSAAAVHDRAVTFLYCTQQGAVNNYLNIACFTHTLEAWRKRLGQREKDVACLSSYFNPNICSRPKVKFWTLYTRVLLCKTTENSPCWKCNTADNGITCSCTIGNHIISYEETNPVFRISGYTFF